MKIKCGHESWIAGASEVNTVAYFAAYNWSTYNSVELFGGGSNEGGKINEFSRATVEAENWVSVDFDLNFYWDGRPSTATYIDIIIFEYDAWPTGTKEKQWTHADGTPIFFVYRSADTNYSTNTILKSDFATTRVTKNCIEWTGIL